MAKHPGSSIERSPQNRRISGAENETRYTSAERDHERIAFALCLANPPVLQARLSVEDWHRISKASRILVLKLDEYDHEVEGFTEYLNSRDPNIKLTMEPVSDGKVTMYHQSYHVPQTYLHKSLSRFGLQPSSGSQKVDSWNTFPSCRHCYLRRGRH